MRIWNMTKWNETHELKFVKEKITDKDRKMFLIPVEDERLIKNCFREKEIKLLLEKISDSELQKELIQYTDHLNIQSRENMIHYTYIWKLDEKVKYCGLSYDPKFRWRTAKYEANSKNENRPITLLALGIRKHGFNNLNREIMEIFPFLSEAKKAEILLIEKFDTFKNGWNSSPGGDEWHGKLHSGNFKKGRINERKINIPCLDEIVEKFKNGASILELADFLLNEKNIKISRTILASRIKSQMPEDLYLKVSEENRIKSISQSMSQFLKIKNNFVEFDEARKIIRSMNFKNYNEWAKYNESKQRIKNIPTRPELTYKDQWTNWSDFLGIDVKIEKNRENTKLITALKVDNAPPDVVAVVSEIIYLDEIIEKFKDGLSLTKLSNFLLTEKDIKISTSLLAKQIKTKISEDLFKEIRKKTLKNSRIQGSQTRWQWLQFEEAKEIARSFKFKTHKDWINYIRSNPEIKNIPTFPSEVYEEWISWNDWLGTEIRGKAKFSQDQKNKMAELYHNFTPINKIAQIYNVNEGTIRRIVENILSEQEIEKIKKKIIVDNFKNLKNYKVNE